MLWIFQMRQFQKLYEKAVNISENELSAYRLSSNLTDKTECLDQILVPSSPNNITVSFEHFKVRRLHWKSKCILPSESILLEIKTCNTPTHNHHMHKHVHTHIWFKRAMEYREEITSLKKLTRKKKKKAWLPLGIHPLLGMSMFV